MGVKPKKISRVAKRPTERPVTGAPVPVVDASPTPMTVDPQRKAQARAKAKAARASRKANRRR